MKLAEKLVYLRKEKGLSQLKLAEMMDVSRQAISRWETGAAVPSAENLKYLGNLYDVSLDYLFNDNEDKPERNSGITEASEDAPVPIPVEEKIHSKRVKTRWLVIAVCIVLLIAAIYIFVKVGAEGDPAPINDLPNEEVEITSDDGFDLY